MTNECYEATSASKLHHTKDVFAQITLKIIILNKKLQKSNQRGRDILQICCAIFQI